jgi:hypothetical protein
MTRNYDKLLQELVQKHTPRNDFSKGFTIADWAIIRHVDHRTMRKMVMRAVDAGDWVAIDGVQRRSAIGRGYTATVYRPKKGWEPPSPQDVEVLERASNRGADRR